MDRLTDVNVIRALAERHGFAFSKRLGQNFLINPAIAPKIVSSGLTGKGVGVLEIGPGIGVLTRELAAEAKEVVAVEIDGRLIPVLAETLCGLDNVKIVNADIMKLDLKEFLAENLKTPEIAVCANLPYYIASPVIMLLLGSRLPFRSITVMVQKEYAFRLCASPGTRESGAITVAVRYYSEPEILFNVSRGSFMPPPNVDSCVIKLVPKASVPFEGEMERHFFRVVRGAFSQRRKTLVNSLSSSLGLAKPLVLSAVNDAGISKDSRPEQLLPEDFVNLSNIVLERFGFNGQA
jgi:16S rRNA (adenine1518-N6/adenine1519-N6)-dimethyltransferase